MLTDDAMAGWPANGCGQIHVRPAGGTRPRVAERVAHLPLRGGVARYRTQAHVVGRTECRVLCH